MARIRKATRAKSNVLPEPENHEEEGKDKEEKEAAKEKEKEEEKEKYIQGKEMGKAKAETEEEEEGEGERQVEGEVEAASTNSMGQDQRSVEQGKDNEDAFRAQLAKLGLRIVHVTGDGNCLFRALSHQLCGDQELYAEYHDKVVHHLVWYPEEFADFFSEGDAGSFEEFYTKMSQDAARSVDLELHAASKAFYTNIRVYWFDQGQLAVSEIKNFDDAGTLLLSYHNGTNFNSLHIKGCDSSEDSEEEEEEEEDDAARTSSTGQDQRSVEQGKDNMDAFRAQLAELGLRIVDITGDGNCLFRALSDQLCGDQESHAEYRQTVVQYLVSYPEEFAGFFSEGNAGSFEEYYTKMSKDAEWGGNLELYAASKAFYMNIRVYRFDQGQLAVSEINNFDDAGTLLLSYHNGTHYNSLHIKGCDNSEDEERADYKTKEKMKDSEEHDNDSVELITSATGYTGADLIRSELQLVDGDTAAAVDMILEELTSTMDSAKNDEGEIVDPPCINNDSQRNSRKRKYTQMKRKTRRVMRITIATAAKKA
ncbi:hypothetical protein SUGI_0447180 [Cryptomeria japonica]|uniref:uncharacterized protein LOC131061628 isoform X1 n=1 Tax=Cryptomeria japonica TaxID=3369 RepID=UPI002408C2C7|nr:uncharacterized protein LOC131061628 isoform X1 [Cryptomeria japonica]GLJ23612.1 hypothetical protein SUGI_0447180 [Cryptomeria japonica]